MLILFRQQTLLLKVHSILMLRKIYREMNGLEIMQFFMFFSDMIREKQIKHYLNNHFRILKLILNLITVN